MRVKEGHCQYIKSGLSLTIEQGESHHAWTARRNLTYHLAASGDAYIPTRFMGYVSLLMPIYVDHCKRTCNLYVIRSIFEFYMVSE